MLCFGGPLHGRHASSMLDELPGFQYEEPEEVMTSPDVLGTDTPVACRVTRYERITLVFAQNARASLAWRCWYDTRVSREGLFAVLLPWLRWSFAQGANFSRIEESLRAWCREWPAPDVLPEDVSYPVERWRGPASMGEELYARDMPGMSVDEGFAALAAIVEARKQG